MSATTEEKTSKKSWLSYIPLVLLALTFILPLLFMLFSSLKPKDQILSDLTTFRAFLPVGDLSLDNYVGVFNRVPVARFFLNSIIVTTTIVVLGLIVNSMAGFAIARLNFRGKKVLLGAIIATLTSRITSLGLADVRGALGVGFDEGAWINTAFTASQMFVGPLAIVAIRLPGSIANASISTTGSSHIWA